MAEYRVHIITEHKIKGACACYLHNEMKAHGMRLVVRYFLSELVQCLVLVLLTPADTVEVISPTGPVISLVGDDVILPCTLISSNGPVNAAHVALEWQRADLKQEVHFYTDSRDSNMDQNPSYRGRTSLFREQLKNGNVSLKLTSVKLSDAGNYSCYVPSLDKEQKAFVHLVVGESTVI
ncbi:hypothetical protein UPYG_G00246730 [Umbra pygmaea]|uniref:Ig-like domain-containing protein n=1 Tax=Umbra pygmaea TaxID=75934 RepID=A0ABD0X0L4_UMBPY